MLALCVGGCVLGLLVLLFVIRPKSLTVPVAPQGVPAAIQPRPSLPKTGDKYLVFGTGFLGSRIAEELLARGESVRVFDLAPCERLQADDRVQCVTGDVKDAKAVLAACEGVQCVFHTIALRRLHQSMPYQLDPVYQTNSVGTNNVLDACSQQGVRRLVFTSDCLVTVDTASAKQGMTENDAYTVGELNHFGVTKALAEKFVRNAHGRPSRSGVLLTVCLRVGQLFGPGDNLISPAVTAGQMSLLYPNSIRDYVYVDNAVDAHLVAEARLCEGMLGVAGQVFNITNQQPMSALDFAGLVKARVPGLTITRPSPVLMWCLAWISELIQVSRRNSSPPTFLGKLQELTPCVLTLASLSFSHDSSKADRGLGFRPAVPLAEGVRRTVESLGRKK